MGTSVAAPSKGPASSVGTLSLAKSFRFGAEERHTLIFELGDSEPYEHAEFFGGVGTTLGSSSLSAASPARLDAHDGHHDPVQFADETRQPAEYANSTPLRRCLLRDLSAWLSLKQQQPAQSARAAFRAIRLHPSRSPDSVCAARCAQAPPDPAPLLRTSSDLVRIDVEVTGPFRQAA